MFTAGLNSEPEPDCEVSFVGWRGRTSVRSFVPRFERQHSLRMFGEDLNKFSVYWNFIL